MVKRIESETRVRLGGVEYDRDGFAAWYVRSYFLDVIRQKYDYVLRRLYEDVYLKHYLKHEPVKNWAELSQGDRSDELRQALGLWAMKYNLADAFFLETAVATMGYWTFYDYNDELDPVSIGWVSLGPSPVSPIPPAFQSSPLKGWNPYGKTREAYRKAALGALAKELDTYLDNQEPEGVEPTEEARSARLHCEWLVDYKVGRLTYDQIAAEYKRGKRSSGERSSLEPKVKANTVGTAVRKMAAIAGIALRRSTK